LIILFPLCAFGKKDTELRQIDAYIAEHDYNAALAIINTYLETHPENFDAVHKRVTKIIAARNDFAAVANELIDVMLNDPENHEKKLALITKLETMEKNPSESSVNFMAETKRASQFTYYRVMFAELMRRGSDAVRAGNYNEGMRNFYAGLDLYQADFFQAGYPDAITVSVRQTLDALADAPRDVQAMLPRVDRAVQAFNAAVASRNQSAVVEAAARALAVFDEYAQMRNKIQSQGLALKRNFNELLKIRTDVTEASFLAFAQRFVLGQGQNAYSGMLGAIDVNFERGINSMRNAIVTEEQKIGREILADLGGNPLEGIASNKTAFEKNTGAASRLADVALNVNDFYSMLDTEDAQPGTRQRLYPNFVRSIAVLKNYIEKIDAMAGDAQIVHSFPHTLGMMPEDTPAAFRTRTVETGDSEFAARLIERAQNAAAVSRGTESGIGIFAQTPSDGTERTAGYGRDAETPLRVDEDALVEWGGFAQSGTALGESLKTESDAIVSSAWKQLALFYADASNKIADDYAARMQRARLLLDPAQPGEPSYPDKVLEETRDVLAALRGDRTLMREAVSRLGAGTDMNEQVPQSETAINGDIVRLNTVESDADTLTARAQERIALAQRALAEAELRYDQAARALAAQDFDSARDNLQRARTRFNESLALRESPAVRADSDARLAALGERIASEENDDIVREVRDLKTRARLAYNDGDFETAENLLNRAQSRWRITNIEDDTEIRTLLAFVGTAISMKTGRTIPITAPLYPEMSQTLNISRLYYNQGAVLLRQGKRDEAANVLNTAKQKLKELQLVYPFNQEASLLTLRIDQLTDPRAFETQFANRVAAARTDYRGIDTRQRAYADLLDLYEINPSYPGLRNLITQVEIEIGIRARPIDQTALANSRTLTTQAQNLVKSGAQNEVALRQALSLVDQAIELNPNNSEAVILKDRILSMLGGQAVTVLSGADESAYQRAIQELQRGNILEAKAIVEQLLQKGTNRRSFKVLDLQKKVDSLL
jgi:outer membrane protein assembly factor BamD (BamD/ComL family)